MRIISGIYRSRHLKAVPPGGTRPTSDKLRETLFNILGESVRGCTFLDACAGVGAIGIEAISRGAENVVFIDESRKAARMIRENLDGLGIKQGFKVLEMDLKKGLDVCRRDGVVFDVAFVDPPYERQGLYEDALDRLSQPPLLGPDGVVILEASKRPNIEESCGTLTRVRTVTQGDSMLMFYRQETV